MAVFKTKGFHREFRYELSDEALLLAAQEVADGNADADLGGGVFKQRVARQGQGKSGGYRTLILHKRGKDFIFAYGFPKNERSNISDAELKALRRLSKEYADKSAADIAAAIEAGELIEVEQDEDDEDDEG